jgi:hypothetical protein
MHLLETAKEIQESMDWRRLQIKRLSAALDEVEAGRAQMIEATGEDYHCIAYVAKTGTAQDFIRNGNPAGIIETFELFVTPHPEDYYL